VRAQADTESAELAKEREELTEDAASELDELTRIYMGRGLDKELAHEVAAKLTAHDALGAHARDELGMSEISNARPVQAAVASAITFAIGAGLPLLAAVMAPLSGLMPVVAGSSLVFLAVLGSLAARAGGASVATGALRVTFWGALAMAVTAGVGSLFGTAA